MEFTKMQGIGNDYVYVDCFREKVEHPGAVSKYVSDRHFGIGSDGLILICPSDKADCRMDMYNADGSHRPVSRHLDPLRQKEPGILTYRQRLHHNRSLPGCLLCFFHLPAWKMLRLY